MESFNISYRELVDVAISCDRKVNKCMEHIKCMHSNLSEGLLEEICRRLTKAFLPSFGRRWQAASRNKKGFLAKNEDWVNQTFSVDIEAEPVPSKRFKNGRPEKPFDDCCERTKRHKVKKLCQNTSADLITIAAGKIRKHQSAGFTSEEALALMLDASLSKYQYEVLRKATINIGCDIFPPYYKVLNLKKECYPERVEVTESCASVGLQELLDHTTTRIMKTKSEEEVAAIGDELTLITKWGCDGSSGHSEYKQQFAEDTISDTNMFLTSLVPLHLCQKHNTSLVHWKNISPSSTRNCRPVKFELIKETAESTKNEIARMETEIKNLKETIVCINNRTLKVNHQLLFTMIDGKIAQTVTETSSMAVCCICKAKPSEMNNLDLIRTKPERMEVLNMGLSPLHARIKFMECILNIAYRNSFKSWRTNKDTKPIKDETKKRIQEEFYKRMGLKVDCVKQGMGTTNDGNTSRRFFRNPALTSEITGVDEHLIHRFSVILQTINCGGKIDAKKFGEYTSETAELYVSLYDWYNMPNTVHKILIHGTNIITAAILPIGMLTEEAQEARNKDYRKYRLSHSRKCSRLSTNEDIMHMLLASSDPWINNLRVAPNKKHIELDSDVKDLIISN